MANNSVLLFHEQSMKLLLHHFVPSIQFKISYENKKDDLITCNHNCYYYNLYYKKKLASKTANGIKDLFKDAMVKSYVHSIK